MSTNAWDREIYCDACDGGAFHSVPLQLPSLPSSDSDVLCIHDSVCSLTTCTHSEGFQDSWTSGGYLLPEHHLWTRWLVLTPSLFWSQNLCRYPGWHEPVALQFGCVCYVCELLQSTGNVIRITLSCSTSCAINHWMLSLVSRSALPTSFLMSSKMWVSDCGLSVN